MSFAWDFGDGMRLSSGPTVTHAYAAHGTYRVTLTVSNDSGVLATQSRDIVVNSSPTARFTYACSGWICTFDGSGSSDPDGSITTYYWSFSDGGSAGGRTATHLYNAAGAFIVTLTVTDNRDATGSQQQVIDLSNLVNAPPVASFTVVCAVQTCTFDGSASSDPDGIITRYSWAFGDGTTASGWDRPIHTYAAGGTYAVSLIVTDNFGATSVQTRSVTLIQPTMHIADLDGVRTNQQNSWTTLVTIAVHDSSHGPVANATVSGSWSIGGAASCTTDSSGQCLVSRSTIPRKNKSVTFTIVNVTRAPSLYTSVDNHDPDGDSDGNSVTVNNP